MLYLGIWLLFAAAKTVVFPVDLQFTVVDQQTVNTGQNVILTVDEFVY